MESTSAPFVNGDDFVCRKYGTYNTSLALLNSALAIGGNLLTVVTMLKTRTSVGQKGRAHIVNLSLFDLLVGPSLIVDLVLGYTGRMCQVHAILLNFYQ
jgi:hypothetical protein